MPRVGLTRERVIDVAQQLADAGGLMALTLTDVAREAGVRKPSLYKHVDGLPAIHEALAARCFRVLAAALRESRDLPELARRWRAFAHAHPGLYEAGLSGRVAQGPEAREAADEALGALFALLGAHGLGDDERVHAARALRAVVHGFVTLERAGGFALDVSVDDSFDRAVATLLRGLGG